MGLETSTYVNGLNSSNPAATDGLSQADDHLRLIKANLLSTFPNLSAAMTATAAELNILDGATVTTAELNILDGVTSTAAELNILDGVTATAAEINVLDGITATVGELNILDGVTATAAELNVLDGITATVGELNILDGVTATTAELNILDGVTATAAEINLLDGASTLWNNNSASLSTGSSNSSNGYVKLPNGLYIQWGYNSATTAGYHDITFPTAFPNYCFSVVVSIANFYDDPANPLFWVARNPTTTKFSTYSGTVISDKHYIAIGY
jgi:hypothetical protein